jgi:hypothetical protein
LIEDKPFHFVVTATGPSGVFWLSKPGVTGVRTLVVREQADEFSTVADAQRAIVDMPRAFTTARVSFAIELAGDFRATRPRAEMD